MHSPEFNTQYTSVVYSRTLHQTILHSWQRTSPRMFPTHLLETLGPNSLNFNTVSLIENYKTLGPE